LFDLFPIKNGLIQGDSLPPLLFNFTLDYASRRVQVKKDSFKLSGTYQFLVYADDNIVGGSVRTVKRTKQFL